MNHLYHSEAMASDQPKFGTSEGGPCYNHITHWVVYENMDLDLKSKGRSLFTAWIFIFLPRHAILSIVWRHHISEWCIFFHLILLFERIVMAAENHMSNTIQLIWFPTETEFEKKNKVWPGFPDWPSLNWVPGNSFESGGHQCGTDHMTPLVPIDQLTYRC